MFKIWIRIRNTVCNIKSRSSLETAYRELAEMKHRLTEAKDEANATALAAEADLRHSSHMLTTKKWVKM